MECDAGVDRWPLRCMINDYIEVYVITCMILVFLWNIFILLFISPSRCLQLRVATVVGKRDYELWCHVDCNARLQFIVIFYLNLPILYKYICMHSIKNAIRRMAYTLAMWRWTALHKFRTYSIQYINMYTIYHYIRRYKTLVRRKTLRFSGSN